MSAVRGQFSSRIGFIMAATGSAVGLGNIWSFPTNTASNGGAAFVLVYAALAFLLAYPALMAELILGRHARRNMVDALSNISSTALSRHFGRAAGYYGVLIACLILSFYAIVAGWMMAYLAESLLSLLGIHSLANWLTAQSLGRDLFCAGIFSLLTMLIIAKGIEEGIEKWSTRLMPTLVLLLFALIIYVLTQEGAIAGLKHYLLPDLSQLTRPELFISAMGQAFFSLSLGVGTMLIYGSYLSRTESLPRMGVMVTLVDMGIAFTAGLLILPAIYAAQAKGVQVFTEAGTLIDGPGLIFQVLPTLFDSMGAVGGIVGLAFFTLMSIAALTSSISMLEVPVALTVEKTRFQRPLATFVIGCAIFAFSALIIVNFDTLFMFVINLTTKYSEPLLGMVLCIYAGWVLRRDQLLKEVKEGHEDIEHTLFWKLWPLYVRVVCPALILLTFVHSLMV